MTEIQITKPGASDAITEAQSELAALDERAEDEGDKSVPANTRRAYEFELACFISWCGRHGVRPMPTEPRVLRGYLKELSESGRDKADVPKRSPKGPLGYSSLMRALAAICHSHQQSGHPSPWKHPVIEKARDTFARNLGKAPKKQKRALEATGTGEALLFQVCNQITDDVRGVRDRAMLLVGWSSGRRRSEITAAHVEHFTEIEEGIRWVIPRSKADQAGKGLVVLMTPSDDERYCPVSALRRWLEISEIKSGPVFRGVDAAGKIMAAALAPEGVSRRVQFYVERLGLDSTEFGGHSLRSGFVTTAYRLGESALDIAASTGHHGVVQVNEYVRRAGLQDAAGPGLLNKALARRKAKEPEEK